jgi:hypothetical protein
VSGSVNIKKAKKKKAESFNVVNKVLGILEPFIKVSTDIVTNAEIMKLNNKSARRSFLIIKNPPKSTKGNIFGVPIHQLAVSFIVKAVSTTAKAAGLNICFLYIVNIYFDAIAQTEAQKASGKNCEYIPPCAGVIKKNKIKAVMYIDSVLVGALYA